MYLHRLLPDLAHPQARRDFSDPYQMHCTLARAFSQNEGASPERFLWRVEVDRAARPVVLVQSSSVGYWQRLFEQFPGYAADVDHKKLDLTRVLHTGREYRFRLRANPTVTRAGRRHGLVREEEQLAWLARQGERLGFGVRSCVVSAQQRLHVRRRRSSDSTITVLACQFDGSLEVIEVEALVAAIAAGIGHAKSLGLGLLSIARA